MTKEEEAAEDAAARECFMECFRIMERMMKTDDERKAWRRDVIGMAKAAKAGEL